MDISTNELERVEVPSLEKEEVAFKEHIIGQDEAVRDFSHLLVNLKSGIRPPTSGPLDVLFLAGPSGVGKTETTLT
jgi:ATP-dependent Clp protease ATP-binding subunit ClpA